MSRRGARTSGFNTPFAGLSKHRPPTPPSAPPRTPQPSPPPEPRRETDFRSAMNGVTPLLDPKSRVEPAKREETSQPDDDALALAQLHALVRGEGDFRLIDTDELRSGMAPGVSFELVERLQRGAYAFRRHLDLHGHTREQAKEALVAFISTARHDAERCVLVVTGRGKGSPDGVSVLRDALPRWLSRGPLKAHVLAFCTARPHDGGPGAFYVLLRRPGVRPYGGVT